MLVTTTMTWQSAREYCLKQNGDLASISSDEEFQFLYETFVKDKGAESKWSKGQKFLLKAYDMPVIRNDAAVCNKLKQVLRE